MNVHEPTAEIIELGAVEVIEITELSPYDDTFIGKRIKADNSIVPYPKVTYWRQHVARCPATVVALFDYLREARTRNICLIRGAPANRRGSGHGGGKPGSRNAAITASQTSRPGRFF